MPGQFGQVRVNDLVFGAVCICATHVQTGPVPDGLDNPDVVAAVVVAAFALRDAVGNVGGLHIDGVSLAICRAEVGSRTNANQAVHGTHIEGVL